MPAFFLIIDRDYRLCKDRFFFGSEEAGMNRSGSLPNHENLTVYEGLPPQGLSEARRAGSFF